MNHDISKSKHTIYLEIGYTSPNYSSLLKAKYPEAEFKEFEPRLKYGSFHLKLFQML